MYRRKIKQHDDRQIEVFYITNVTKKMHKDYYNLQIAIKAKLCLPIPGLVCLTFSPYL